MRQITLTLLLIVASSATAQANEQCEGWKSKASLYMNWRQQGIPIAQAVKETAGNVSRGLLLQAYNEPQQQDFEAQYKATEQFSEKIYQECLEGPE